MRASWLVILLVACSGPEGAHPAAPKLAPAGPPLPPLEPIDPHERGARYLTLLASHIQPRWAQFLEDCRMRLGADHPLNITSLTADIELLVDDRGVVKPRVMQPSGNSDFDGAALEVLREVPPAPPPIELESDDGLVHVHWVFARDRRQAGPATAKVLVIELPLVATAQRLLERTDGLARAAKRLAAAPAANSERLPATELVMIAALREGLASSDGATREAALEAVAKTQLAALAPDVHRLIDASGQIEQRVKAIEAAAALRDARVLSTLVTELDLELADRPEIALAKISALVALDMRDDAARAIRGALGKRDRRRGIATAISALAVLPDPKLTKSLATWFANGDPEIRGAVCKALPSAAPRSAKPLIARGLRDADASVRSSCASAAGRARIDRAITLRLVELARDRDEAVRMEAVAALPPAQRPRAVLQDRSPRVRAAAAAGAPLDDLRTLFADKAPDVRAAAIAELAERAPADLALAAARDPAAQVRRASVAAITDDAILEHLASDADPDVATAALVRHAARRGRATMTTPLLLRLVAATPKSLERVRIARSWLLAP